LCVTKGSSQAPKFQNGKIVGPFSSDTKVFSHESKWLFQVRAMCNSAFQLTFWNQLGSTITQRPFSFKFLKNSQKFNQLVADRRNPLGLWTQVHRSGPEGGTRPAFLTFQSKEEFQPFGNSVMSPATVRLVDLHSATFTLICRVSQDKNGVLTSDR
jgi:hypothetical protein